MRIIHQTGEHDYNEVRKTYQERGLLAEVHAFIDDMPGALAQADLVISRAGATAVAELAAAGRAALLIPFPAPRISTSWKTPGPWKRRGQRASSCNRS